MMFQFLNGRRPPNTASLNVSATEQGLSWETKASAHGNHAVQAAGRRALRHAALGQSPTVISSVEQACAAFHDAQTALVATFSSGEEIDAELYSRRDTAFEQVRSFPALTKEACQAKKRVLDVMRSWLSIDAPVVAEFSFEVLTEAMAFLEVEPAQECSCHHTEIAVPLSQTPGSDRRHPLSWFIRPRGDTTDAPFAN